MSASKEKKNRQASAGMDWSDPKTAREAQQRKEERRSNRMYAAIAIVFVIVAVVTVVWKTNVIQRTVPAVTINGENYTSAEVNYYYKNIYQSVISNYYNYLSYLELDTSASMKSQKMNSIAASMLGGTEGESWYNFFLDTALNQMCLVRSMVDAAAKDNFTWSDAMESDFQDNMDTISKSATSYGYTVKQYISLVYGNAMTQSTLEQAIKDGILAQAYSQNYENSLTYTTDQLTTAYNADPNSYDVVDCQYVTVSGSPATTDASGNTVDVTDAMKTEAMTKAKTTADSIYASYKGGKSLSDLSSANDGTSYSAPTGSTHYDTVLSNWLFDSARKAGDSAVLEDTSTSNYYVVVFGSRYRYDYKTVNVRHILLKIDDSALDSTSATYNSDLQALKDTVKAKADALLAQWKSGEATEDSFAKLANENSEDTGSNTTGGLYSQVHKGQMVDAFNDWCFDASRKAGDTGIVYAERTGSSSDYKGYHIIYFVGEDLPYWQVQVTSQLKSDDYNTWQKNLSADYTAEQHSLGMRFVG